MLQIIENSAQQLVAVQTPYRVPHVAVFGMAVALCLMVYTAFRKNWWMSRFFLLLLGLFGAVALIPSQPAYRLQVDRVHGRVASWVHARVRS